MTIRPIEYLKKLSTVRLLNYFKSIRKLVGFGCEYDWDSMPNCDCLRCEFRKRYEPHLNEVRALLNTREHVKRKK